MSDEQGSDPVAEENRTIGEGLFEREMGPSSSMAHGLDPSSDLLDEDWREELADDYRNPKVKISYEEALAHRLRRIYLPMLTIVLAAWLIRSCARATSAGGKSRGTGRCWAVFDGASGGSPHQPLLSDVICETSLRVAALDWRKTVV